MRILVVEDETALADVVVRGLRQAGLAVDVAYDGRMDCSRPKSARTMWWCWIASCPACSATMSAAR
jgi:DNA-binding response OmpR family regulator